MCFGEPAPLPEAQRTALQSTLDGVLDGGPLGSATVGALVVDLETDAVLSKLSAGDDAVRSVRWLGSSRIVVATVSGAVRIGSPVARTWVERLRRDAGGQIATDGLDLYTLGETWSR